TASPLELDGHLELYARLAFDQHPWRGARRRSRPTGARFESLVAIGRSPAEEYLVRSLGAEGCVGTRLVVPSDKSLDLTLERAAHERHGCQDASAFIFERANE